MIETMIIAPTSISSPSTNGAPAFTTVQDDGPVNRLCEANRNDCRTGCFFMRKIIAHIFGRNKACTRQIPEHCWVQWCRKHYQRLRHRMLEQGWIFLQISCLRTQLSRMEEWGEVQSFTILLQRRLQDELNRNDPAQAPEDDARLGNSPDIKTTSKDDHAKGPTKASPNRFLYPYLGAGRSFDDVYAVINAIEQAANEGWIAMLPPLQFLPLIDATLHPPPPVARPRKKRKPPVYKKQVHYDILDSDSNLQTLVDSDTTKNIASSTSRHSSPPLTSSSCLNTIKGQISPELASPPLSNIHNSFATIPVQEIQYNIVKNDDDAAALGIVPNSTNSEVASVGPLPVVQLTRSLNDTKHQVAVETDSLSRILSPENRIDKAFENEIQDSTVHKGKDTAALGARFTLKIKQYGTASNTMQVAELGVQEGGLATKELSGATGLLSSRIETTHNSRKTRVPAALFPKIQALPPSSIHLVDKEHGFVGYKTAKPKSDKSAPSSARRSHLHSATYSHHHAPAAKPPENPPNQFNSYPTDPVRTYNSVLNDTNDQVEASAPDKNQDSPIETHIKQTYSREKHPVENKHKDKGTPAPHSGNPSCLMPRISLNGWTQINAQTTTVPHVISVHNMANTKNNNTSFQQGLAPDSRTSTNSAYPEGSTRILSPSTDEDGKTDPSSFKIPARSISRSFSEPPSRFLAFCASKKRSSFDAEEGSPVEGQQLGKRQMRGGGGWRMF